MRRKDGADPVSRRAIAAAIRLTQAPTESMSVAAGRRVASFRASLPPAPGAAMALAGGAERGVHGTILCSTSLRSMDRSFLLRCIACVVCVVSSPPGSDSDARIASSDAGIITLSVCATCLSNENARTTRSAVCIVRSEAFIDAPSPRSWRAGSAAWRGQRCRASCCAGAAGAAPGPVSRARRSARPAAARRRYRPTAAGSAGCPPPARTHARPSR